MGTIVSPCTQAAEAQATLASAEADATARLEVGPAVYCSPCHRHVHHEPLFPDHETLNP